MRSITGLGIGSLKAATAKICWPHMPVELFRTTTIIDLISTV